MKLTRAPLLLAAAVLLCLSVASATSLGTFTDVVLSGSAIDVNYCRAADVELQDGLGSAIDLVTGGTVEQVAFSGLTGDCDGAVPNIIVIGYPPPYSTEQVLVVEGLAPISPSGGTAIAPVSSSTDLSSIVDGLNLITEVRAAFSPY